MISSVPIMRTEAASYVGLKGYSLLRLTLLPIATTISMMKIGFGRDLVLNVLILCVKSHQESHSILTSIKRPSRNGGVIAIHVVFLQAIVWPN